MLFWWLQTGHNCLLGQTITYKRQKSGKACRNGRDFTQNVTRTPCSPCVQEDYEWWAKPSGTSSLQDLSYLALPCLSILCASRWLLYDRCCCVVSDFGYGRNGSDCTSLPWFTPGVPRGQCIDRVKYFKSSGYVCRVWLLQSHERFKYSPIIMMRIKIFELANLSHSLFLVTAK